jgi:peptidoglycan/xylan/chitin deacetylase (PgdA/CDA1 family)
MSRRTTHLLRTALSALHYSGAAVLMRPVTAGVGVIFMLHSVHPAPRLSFEPNRILRVTPRFLESVIRDTREAGFDFVSLDEVPQRLAEPGARPFAAFTLDDGYRDNRDYAYPVFKRFGVPFTIYVPSDFADGRGDLWWLNLENAIRALDVVPFEMDGIARTFPAQTTRDKELAYHVIYWWLRQQPEDIARARVAALSRQAGHDPGELGRTLLLSWDELRDFAADPLVTIGGHTCGHYSVARLPLDVARREIIAGARRLEQELGRPCRHFSFPYGDETAAGPRDLEIARDAGFLTAVTTRKGHLHAHHAHDMIGLPRLSLNGDFQRSHYLKTLLTGAPFAIRDAVAGLTTRPLMS